MIEVTAKLPGRSVFLAGETLECLVTFTNVVRVRPDGSPSKGKPAKLAWASTQIHCQCSVSETRMLLPKAARLSAADVTTTGNDTSFIPSKGEKGCCVLTSKPTILFCDLTLAPGESQTYSYRETIPLEAPPSFRGTAIKYSYKITIGTQRFDHPAKLLRVPFRVLIVPDLQDRAIPEPCRQAGLHDLSVYRDPGEDLAPSNPFLRTQKFEPHSLLEVALEILQTITCRKGPNFYNITNSKGKVARFCLFKQAYRIGDDIVGTCDFSEATIPCVQFSVTLQSEETISEECRRKASQGTTVTSYSRHTEFCLHTSRTHISIPIPLTATPGFHTDLVTLKWRLHFEFVTAKKVLPSPTPASSASDFCMWQGPAQLDVETMVWDLPIKVFATNPLHATSVSLLRMENSCIA